MFKCSKTSMLLFLVSNLLNVITPVSEIGCYFTSPPVGGSSATQDGERAGRRDVTSLGRS